jgi:hypothetical protein
MRERLETMHRSLPGVLPHVRLPLDSGQSTHVRAIISAGEDDEDHPRKKVVNALTRRGAGVFQTKGMNVMFRHNRPPRDNYTAMTPLPFYDKVEG